MEMLKISDLNVSYGAIHAIHDVAMSVHKGELVSLIGANGAGKTTILHTITGLCKATSGSVVLNETNLLKTDASDIIKLGMAHVPEGRHVFPEMTVEENLEMGAYCVKEKHLIAERVENVYQRFPRLKERYRQAAGTLSGGEQQRVAIARALAKNPKLLLCDEPTGALDYETGRSILKLLQETCKEREITVVVITHNLALIPMGDQVIKVKSGLVDSIMENAHPVGIERIEW